MLLSWTLNASEYNTSTYEVAVDRELTGTERLCNYLVGTVLIFSLLLSTTLNPVLLHHHHSTGKKGVTTFLFSSLALSDFLTNLISPIVYTVFMVKPKVFSIVNATIGSFGIFSCTLGCFSQCLTSLLTITRFLKIINPFKRIKKRTLMGYLVFYAFTMFVNNVLLTRELHKKRLNPFDSISGLICFTLKVGHCLLGVICSIITVLYVYAFKPPSQTDKRTKQACTTILLMNVTSIGTLVCALLLFLSSHGTMTGFEVNLSLQISLFCASFYIMPILTSAWNPIILFSRSSAIRQSFILLMRSYISYISQIRKLLPNF